MTATTTLPLDKICKALVVLQNHGVIGDNEADHALECFCEENGLTYDDLNNYRPDIASGDEMVPLVQALLRTYETEPKEMAWDLAFRLTDGGRKEELNAVLPDFEEGIEE